MFAGAWQCQTPAAIGAAFLSNCWVGKSGNRDSMLQAVAIR
ncbi:MAG: hypothetical protein ACFB12_03280 [Leptolyngbyaceae cyanobacterium]